MGVYKNAKILYNNGKRLMEVKDIKKVPVITVNLLIAVSCAAGYDEESSGMPPVIGTDVSQVTSGHQYNEAWPEYSKIMAYFKDWWVIGQRYLVTGYIKGKNGAVADVEVFI